MDDESSKLFKFLSEKEIFKSTDIPVSYTHLTLPTN